MAALMMPDPMANGLPSSVQTEVTILGAMLLDAVAITDATAKLRPEEWKAENGTVQTYQHYETHRYIHIDGPSGQFYHQQKEPITQQAALDRAMGPGKHHATSELSQAQQFTRRRLHDISNGLGL